MFRNGYNNEIGLFLNEKNLNDMIFSEWIRTRCSCIGNTIKREVCFLMDMKN